MSTVEETLAREAEDRPRAGIAAITAGVFTFAASVILGLVTRDVPGPEDGLVNLAEALRGAAGASGSTGESLIVRQLDAYGDKIVPLTASTVLGALAALLAGYALLYLDRATRARRPETGRAGRIALIVGVALYPIGHLVREISTWVGAANFQDDAVRNAEAAREVLVSGVTSAGAAAEYFGLFGLALAFVLISLNAMRVGLLTRLWGILGVVVGVLAVLQIDTPQFLRTVWLIFVGLLILGRLPGGLLPAWQTGRAEPWPTQQELRERRAAAAGGGGAVSASRTETAAGDEEPAGDGDADGAGEADGAEDYRAGQARRKRKRRH